MSAALPQSDLSLQESAKGTAGFSAEETQFFVELCAQEDKPFIPEHAKVLADGSYVLARQLLLHWTMIQGVVGDQYGYFDRWCFATKELALKAVADYPKDPPAGYEPTGWHRHPRTGRRRPDGDPAQEFIEW